MITIETFSLVDSTNLAQAIANNITTAQQSLVLSSDLTAYNLVESATSAYQLTLYGAQLSGAQLLSFAEQLNAASVDFSQFKLVPSLDDGQDVAFSALLKDSVGDSKLSELKAWASEQRLELWLQSTRPSLSEPGLLLMDMDSTTIKIECIDEIAKLAGVGEEVSKVTELAMQGKLDFAESLRGRVGTLKDADESIIAQVKDNLPLMHGLERMLAVLKQYNWKVAIASGGFTYFANKLKDDLALDAAVANELEVVDGKLTGQVLGGIVDANVKAETLNRLANEYAIPGSQTVAMGDGANDLVMMNAAELGVAFEAKPLVQAQADVAINHHGLDALLFILDR